MHKLETEPKLMQVISDFDFVYQYKMITKWLQIDMMPYRSYLSYVFLKVTPSNFESPIKQLAVFVT